MSGKSDGATKRRSDRGGRRRSAQTASAAVIVSLALLLAGCVCHRSNEVDQSASVLLKPGQEDKQFQVHNVKWLFVIVPAHQVTGFPLVCDDDGDGLCTPIEMIQYADWSATHIVEDSSEFAPFAEPTHRRYRYRLSSTTTEVTVGWSDGKSETPSSLRRFVAPSLQEAP